jgi:N-acetylglucosamine-6-sulfatase
MLNALSINRWLRPFVVLVAIAGAIAPIYLADAKAQRGQEGSRSAGPRAATTRPNIVFILTDDLSMNLLPYMPHVQAMERSGLSFSDYFVSDSLCCPSRSSILTGDFPHDTRVFSNTGIDGGFQKFHDRGEERRTFAVALQAAGYRTALMGKYLNDYLQLPPWATIPRTYVPPGWSEWDVAGWGYGEYNYRLNQDGTLRYYGHRPSDYLTDVVAEKGANFIDGAVRSNSPFFLELATFAPHYPYVPGPTDLRAFSWLTAPEPPNFDAIPANAPRWLARHRPLSAAQVAKINRVFRRRVRAVQAVDRMIGQVEETLAAEGVANNTYLVFSSDNGLHTGEYRLMPGKLTAYDTDIHVPLIIVGPGIRAGTRTSAMAENIDLAETFAAIGGTELSGDGHSLLPLFSGGAPRDWRDAVLIEHHGPDIRGSDPDFQQPANGNPRTYEAIRTHRFLYVEYDDGEREFYDLQNDPFELDNLAAQLPAPVLVELHAVLTAIRHCHGTRACWAAMGPRELRRLRHAHPGAARRPGRKHHRIAG